LVTIINQLSSHYLQLPLHLRSLRRGIFTFHIKLSTFKLPLLLHLPAQQELISEWLRNRVYFLATLALLLSKPASSSVRICNSLGSRNHHDTLWCGANGSSIYNLRRRVAELPALSEEQYDSQVKSQEIVHRLNDNDERGKERISAYDAEVEPNFISEDTPEAEPTISEKVPPTQCLFCNLDSQTLDANLDHMSSQHGLFIPSPDQISDMESFLGYLAIIIFEYNECLYCSLAKGTVDGVQTHMRDKGHCMIMMNTESELLDFWELSDSEDEDRDNNKERTKSAGIKLSKTEMRLPSGVIINSRSDVSQLRVKPGLTQSRTKGLQYRNKRAEMRAIAAEENQETADEKHSRPSGSNDRRVAVRGEMGLAGISESQRRALQLTEKKMKKREAVAKAAQRYAMEQEPIKTKYYKVRDYKDLEGLIQRMIADSYIDRKSRIPGWIIKLQHVMSSTALLPNLCGNSILSRKSPSGKPTNPIKRFLVEDEEITLLVPGNHN
jgi:pre-60S factor REI1